MSNKHFLKRFAAGIALMVLIGVLAACGGKKEGNGTGNDKSSTDTLTIYSQSSTYEGTIGGYVGKALKEKLDVDIKVVPNSVGGTSRFETKLTTGDLGDLIIFTNLEDVEKAKKAGILEDLSGDIDKYENISRFKDAVARGEKLFDGLYGIPTTVSLEAQQTKTNPSWTPTTRYDYYKELGSPAIKSYWDYTSLLEKMVEAHPNTEGGDTFYGLSMFSEWDGKNVNQIKSIAKTMGYMDSDGVNKYEFTDISATEDKVVGILEEDSIYLQGLEWAFDLNQKGLLDPDSASQTWEDYLKKAEKGQSALMIWGYTGELNFNPTNKDLTDQGKGYKFVPFEEMLISDAKTSTIGNNWFWGISNKSGNKDKALELLDFLYSDEGQMFWENGPQGVMWDVNEEGQPYLTDLGLGDWEAKVPEEHGGGVVSDTFKKLANGPTVDQQAVNPNFNEPANRSVWETTLLQNATKLDKDWTEDNNGALNSKELLINEDLIISYDIYDLPTRIMDDELKVIANQVGEIIKEYSWKMIYASNEKNFNELKDEMIKRATDLGYEKCVDFETEGAKLYFEARDK